MKRTFTYKTRNTCSSEILITVDNGTISSVEFVGGCHGNLQGISKLVAGMSFDDVLARLEGIQCGNKSTSCPDQLCKAIRILKG